MFRHIFRKMDGAVDKPTQEPAPADSIVPKPFTVDRPQRRDTPFIFNSPHSGCHYPESFLAASRLDALTLRKSEDTFVNELFADAPLFGAPLMQAHFPRAYLDLNREPYELDPALIYESLPNYANTQSIRVVGGLGTIARVVTESEEIYHEPLPLNEALERINRLYKPYHNILGELMLESHSAFGTAILIDCHSMPSSPAGDCSGPRPDFVLGDRFSTSCDKELTRCVAQELNRLGYVVALNKPYSGGFITEHYGRPAENFHALQIEVNRALYMDEANFEKTSGFDVIRRDMKQLIAMLAEHTPNLITVPKAAAE